MRYIPGYNGLHLFVGFIGYPPCGGSGEIRIIGPFGAVEYVWMYKRGPKS